MSYCLPFPIAREQGIRVDGYTRKLWQILQILLRLPFYLLGMKAAKHVLKQVDD
jgi:hypothetical protein